MSIVDDRFDVGPLTGRGAMGDVHRAHDRKTGLPVAFKVLKSHHDVDRARFAREASVLATLSHENIVRYIAHGETRDGALYLVMEWVEGVDLHVRLGDGPLAIEDVLALTFGIASGMQAAHAKGIVHRDVKPSNVLLADRDCRRSKLADFGIARPRSGMGVTRTGQILGTPEYMAPEQARSAKDIDERVDVFALGCVVYHVLAGRPPFEGDDPRVVLAKVMTTDHERLSRLRDDVPPKLEALVDAMLEKDPSCRPTAGDIAERSARLRGGG